MEFMFGPHLIRSSEIFYRTNLTVGIVNLRPVRPHVERFTSLRPEEVTDLFHGVRRVSKMIETRYKTDSLSIIIQDGPAAGQTVPHLHVHIIPRHRNDWPVSDYVYDELPVKSIELRDLLKSRRDKINTGCDQVGKDRELDVMAKEATELRLWLENEPDTE